jgi:tetrapyrrole methylase family protein / MazG family protein
VERPGPRPRVTVVGLGPAGPTYLTDHVLALMAGSAQTFVRTARHPAAAALVEVTALDHLYESADTFDEVYRAIVDVVTEAAIAHAPEPVVYAVPGSPLVAERTVDLLRREARVELTIVPALSFLDLAWERLGVDPLSVGVRLVDAEDFAAEVSGERGPFLVAQCWSQTLLSEIKLSVSPEESEPTGVVLLHHLGLPDERVERVGWWELDRTLDPDHLTSLYIPGAVAGEGVGAAMVRLDRLVSTLRERCPWDRAQSHASLMPHLLEESYEVLDALEHYEDPAPSGGPSPSDHLCEELGDLLFQIVFHACLAQEEGVFDLADVARGVHDKLVHRHPHVFGDVVADSAEQVVTNWEDIKKREKGRSSVTEGIPTGLPSLLLATKLQRKALSVGVPIPASTDTGIDRLEAIAAWQPRSADDAGESDAPLLSDGGEVDVLVGDLLFTVADLCRRLGIDPELALRSRSLAFRDVIAASESDRGRDES